MSKNLVSMLDESAERHGSTTTMMQVWRIGDYRVRAVIRRDFYENQSSASISVLNSELTWTMLTTSPTSVWWEAARTASLKPDPSAEQDILTGVAAELVNRAKVILP